MPSVLWEQKLPRPRERLLVPVRASQLERQPRRLRSGLRGARAHRQRAVTLAVWKRSYSTSSSMYPSKIGRDDELSVAVDRRALGWLDDHTAGRNDLVAGRLRVRNE